MRSSAPRSGTASIEIAPAHAIPAKRRLLAKGFGYSGENEPIVPFVAPEPLPVMVLFPRDW
jgi:hypothetical protein